MRTNGEPHVGELIIGPWRPELLRMSRPRRLAKEIAEQLVAGHGSVVRWTPSVVDVDLWREAARRGGRILSVPVRTGVSDAGDWVWVVDES